MVCWCVGVLVCWYYYPVIIYQLNDTVNIFNSDNAPLLPDDLHPNNEGTGIMAQNLLGLLPPFRARLERLRR